MNIETLIVSCIARQCDVNIPMKNTQKMHDLLNYSQCTMLFI